MLTSPRVDPQHAPADRASADLSALFHTLTGFATPLAIKLYRLRLDPDVALPTLPCLDHEAMLHEGIAPHAAAYVQDAGGDLHEVVFIPDRRHIDVDVVSTMGECSDAAHERFVSTLKERFPAYRVHVVRASWLKGDRRVAAACRAQVALRDVLIGDDLERTRAAVDRLQTISSLMEKESRVASWGARTVMTPLVAAAGFLSYLFLGSIAPRIASAWGGALRYAVVSVVGAVFLYYGLKAVHLTEMANRVWKRSAEYGLILSERRRLRLTRASDRPTRE